MSDFLHLEGEFDAANSHELRAVLAAAARRTTELTVDLGAVTFLDSSAIRELIAARTALHERGGHLVLTNMSPMTRRVLDVIGALPLFQDPNERD